MGGTPALKGIAALGIAAVAAPLESYAPGQWMLRVVVNAGGCKSQSIIRRPPADIDGIHALSDRETVASQVLAIQAVLGEAFPGVRYQDGSGLGETTTSYHPFPNARLQAGTVAPRERLKEVSGWGRPFMEEANT
jgi:hypothetical protein